MADEVSTGELARQVRDVFERFSDLAKRLEAGQFVRTDLYNLQVRAFELAINALEARCKAVEETKPSKSEFENLRVEVAELKDDKKWLIRLVLTFIIMGVLAAAFVARGAG